MERRLGEGVVVGASLAGEGSSERPPTLMVQPESADSNGTDVEFLTSFDIKYNKQVTK